jgi:hypothetical protein
MPEITMNLPDGIYNQIANRYGADAVGDFTLAATGELISWLAAEERPTSISELETNRIFSIYANLLKDILPTAEDIGQAFNLPMGRSRYIVQNLNYRYPAFMKRRRLTAIIAALELNELSEDGLPIAIIPKECDDYLVTLSTELVLARQMESVPRRIRLSESLRIELGVHDKAPLLKRLRDELKKLPG